MVFFWILAGLVWLGGVISIMTEMIRNRGTNFAKMRTRLAQNSEHSSEPESQKIDLSQNGQTFVPNVDPVRNENSIQNGNQKIPLGRYLKQKITKRGVKMTDETKIIFLFYIKLYFFNLNIKIKTLYQIIKIMIIKIIKIINSTFNMILYLTL